MRRAVPRSITGRAGFLAAVARRLTPRKLAVAQAAALSLFALRMLQFYGVGGGSTPASMWQSGLIITTLDAQLVLIAVTCADEAVKRALAAWLAYPAALLCASVCAAVGQWYIRGWLQIFTVVNQPGIPAAVQRTQMIAVAFEVLTFGGVATLVYLNRRRALELMRRARGMEYERVAMQRRLVESRLAAAEVRLDPRLLLQELTGIRDLYRDASPQAEPHLDELIARLRARRAPTGTRGDAGPAESPA